MSITKRLILTLVVSVAAALVIGSIAFYSIDFSTKTTHRLVTEDFEYLSNTKQLKILALQHRRYEKDFFLNIGKPEKQKKYLEKFNKVSSRIRERMQGVAHTINQKATSSNDEKQLIQDAMAAYEVYYASFMELAEKVLEQGEITPQKANKLMTPFKKHIYTFEKGIDALEKRSREELRAMVAGAGDKGVQLRNIVLVSFLTGTLFILLSGAFTAYRIRSGLNLLSGRLEELSGGNGDLTYRFEIDHNDQIGKAFSLLNRFLENLRQMMVQISQNSSNLDRASRDLSVISSRLSSETEQSSRKLERISGSTGEVTESMTAVSAAMEQSDTNISMIAAATEEMGATVNEIARNSDKIRSVTNDAVQKAQNASASISELNNLSAEIGKVTDVISEISEQTNLLALNATIEAARAGEAGKGFAVVANEIKDLAGKTADATQEIKTRIEKVQTNIKADTEIVADISKTIEHVDEMVAVVTAAAGEQAGTTREIADNVNEASQGLGEISDNLGQNSALVSGVNREVGEVDGSIHAIDQKATDLEKKSRELSNLSESLNEMIARFKV